MARLDGCHPKPSRSSQVGVAEISGITACATDKGLAGWWTPDVKATPERNSLARFRFSPDYFKEMRITELVPSTRVSWFCIAGADEWVDTTVTFRIEGGRPDSTNGEYGKRGVLLRFSHDDWKDQSPMFAECNYTWGRFLGSLKLLCETGTGHSTPNEHRVLNGS